jgi:aldose 1-epimerase
MSLCRSDRPAVFSLCGMLLTAVCLFAQTKPANLSQKTDNQKETDSRSKYTMQRMKEIVGGRAAVAIEMDPAALAGKPGIIHAEILPGRGMNVYQLRASIPGKGIVELLASPNIQKGAQTLIGSPEDPAANKTFGMGGPILLPWANRIRGTLSANQQTIEAQILGHKLPLLANGASKKPDGERAAIHGLILARPMDKVTLDRLQGHPFITGILDAGNFNGHWLSKSRVTIRTGLVEGKFRLEVTAENTGESPLPMAIGWHPFFTILSAKREQVRVRIPASGRALVNNYDDVLPTGEIQGVEGTPYDFRKPGGAAIGKMALDDCYVDLQRDGSGQAVSELVDAAAGIGLRIRAISPEIKAIQLYAPTNRNVVAIEPQFNVGDPFSNIWKGRDTGMVLLQPGKSTTYLIEVEVFTP